MATIRQLPSSSIRLLKSSQVITSVPVAVKELVENSLDAGAKNISIKLENWGLDKIEVHDDGAGIRCADTPTMAQPHCTSKISSHADLQNLHSYGFRGEALSSLCEVANVKVSTKSTVDLVGFCYELDREGHIQSKKPSPLECGTVVVATDLFRNIPVRRKFFDSNKKKKEELKKTEDIIMAFSIIHPGTRFAFHHNRTLIWQKANLLSRKDCLMHVFGPNVVNHMQYVTSVREESKHFCEAYLPEISCITASRSQLDRCFISVNQRPILSKEIEQLILKYYCKSPGERQPRFPVCFLSITTPPSEIDVNIEPNKTKVLFNDQEEVLKVVEHVLEKVYGPADSCDSTKENQTTGNVTCHSKINHVNSLVMDMAAPSKTAKIGVTSNSVSSVSMHSCEKQKHPTSDKNISNPAFKDWLNELPSLQMCNGNCTEKQPEMPPKYFDVPSTFASCEISKATSVDPTLSNQVPNMLLFTGNDSNKISNEPVTTSENDQPPNQRVFLDLPEDKVDYFQKTTNNKIPSVSYPLSSRPVITSEEVVSNIPRAISDLESTPMEIVEEQREMKLTSGKTESCEVAQNNDNTRWNTFESVESVRSINSNDNWSKGNFKNTEGKNIECAALHLPTNAKRPITPALPSMQFASESASKSKKKKVMVENRCVTTLYDVFASKLTKRPLNAFHYYCNQRRPEVIAKFPDLNDESINIMLSQEWEGLLPEERDKHVRLAERDQIRQTLNFKLSSDQDNQKPNRELSKNVASKPSSAHTNIMRYNTKEVQLLCSLQDLRIQVETQSQHSQISDMSMAGSNFSLIGMLDGYDVWMASHKEEIVALNYYRIRESTVLKRLLSTHQFQMETLEPPIHVTKNSLTNDLWKTLLTLECEVHYGYKHIVDERIMSNGFDIRFAPGSDQQVEIIRLFTSMPLYGLPDLRELLEVISVDPSASLSNTRSSLATQFLQKEAMRIARNSPPPTKMEMYALIDVMGLDLAMPSPLCVHKKPFFSSIYDMNNIPLSQIRCT